MSRRHASRGRGQNQNRRPPTHTSPSTTRSKASKRAAVAAIRGKANWTPMKKKVEARFFKRVHLKISFLPQDHAFEKKTEELGEKLAVNSATQTEKCTREKTESTARKKDRETLNSPQQHDLDAESSVAVPSPRTKGQEELHWSNQLTLHDQAMLDAAWTLLGLRFPSSKHSVRVTLTH